VSGHEGLDIKADRAARAEAEAVIDRWNRRLATGRDMLWSLRGCLPARLGDRGGRRWLSRHTFQLPKTGEVVLHLRESLFARQKTLLKIGELSATSRLRVAILDPRKERCHRCSRLCNAGSKPGHFGLCICDRRAHGFLNERDPTSIRFLVAI
jgi:hypothetical protein